MIKMKNAYLYTIFESYMDIEVFFGSKLTINIHIPSRKLKIKQFLEFVSFFNILLENFSVIHR